MLLQRLAHRCLELLEAHDAAHGTGYIATLRACLLADCNMLKTADMIHNQRNTVVYRMGRIREMLGSQLKDYE